MENTKKAKVSSESPVMDKTRTLRETILEQQRTAEDDLSRLRAAISQRESHLLKLQGALEAIDLVLSYGESGAEGQEVTEELSTF